jgi:hypothetical protein
VIAEPVVDRRRVESLVQELRRYAPQYTPDLNLSDEQSVAPALMRVFAHLAEAVLVRLGKAPAKHFVAFLDRLGISLLPARPARVPVTFKLATGFEQVVRVPVGSRVTAPGAEDDIPFETTGELMAVPGGIAAAYGVDPARDLIVEPPLGLLAQEIHTATELVYTVQSFAAAGTRRLQFDHVTELLAGSYITIACRERVVVEALADGNIVTLQAPLAHDVAADTRVTPVRAFEPFGGVDPQGHINLQEHVLYIGHADLFTVKEAVDITVDVAFAELGAGVTLQPLDVVWQFWTTVGADSPEPEELWYDFTVRSDSTAGLSRSGRVTLTKPDLPGAQPDEPEKLEIQEREVGGVTSKWIRAYLRGALTAATEALPAIDTIEIGVLTPEGDPGIAADQGFNNATPLDLQVEPDVGFFPFGTEPRQFDQFYIASKEAFSKRGAQATLQFALDLQTLAAPSFVATTAGFRAYSVGLRRQLYGLDLTTGIWQALGSPSTKHPQGGGYFPVEDTAPSTIKDTTDLLYTFVKTENTQVADLATRPNKIWVFLQGAAGTNGTWTDIDAPPAGDARQVLFNPAAIVLPAGFGAFARVFAISQDGKLSSRDITSAPAPLGVDWQTYNPPQGAEPFASSPFVTVRGAVVLVFITGADGIVYQATLAGGALTWTALTPNNQTFQARSRPFALPYGPPVQAKIFVFGVEANGDGQLFECDTSTIDGDGRFAWENLGRPAATTPLGEIDPDVFAPTGHIEVVDEPDLDVEGKHIFLRGADGALHERLDEEVTAGTDGWELRTRPGDPSLRDAPVTLVSPGTPETIHVLAASSRNSLITWDFEVLRGTVIADATTQAVMLDQTNADSVDGTYNGQDLTIEHDGDQETNEVLSYDGAHRVARLALPPLEDVPDSTYSASIDGVDVGPVDDDTDTLIVLAAHATDGRVARALSVRVDNAFVALHFYSRLTGVASMDPSDLPGLGEAFTVHLEVQLPRTEIPWTGDTSGVPELSWEYWNGRGWLSLSVDDGTNELLAEGDITFTVPKSIQPTEVAGQENFWIRARLVGGDYGRETFKIVNNEIVSEKSTLRPPKVRSLSILYEAQPEPAATCLSFNNLDYLDQTAASLLGGAHFPPFYGLERVPDRDVSLFFGFDRPFRGGPMRILFDAAEREYDESNPPELDWQFRKDRIWKPLDAQDETVALLRQGLLTLSASETLTRETRFGQSLFWIRGSLRTDRGTSGAAYPRPLLRGIFLNTVFALQGETIVGEILGSSDGEQNQVHAFQHPSVLDGEEIRVREPLSAEEREQIERTGGIDSVVDREDLGGTWVRWTLTDALFESSASDRHYLLDRAAGRLQFGDGVHGSIPPPGSDNIRAFRYRTGGGVEGNVAPGAIEALVTAVVGIESVFNPTAAGGGSDQVDTAAMLTIGPRRISHRDRAVSAEDFESLAAEASRQVAKVRCLAATNLARLGAGRPDPCDHTQRHDARPAAGWVSLILVPDSLDPRPCPSLELRRAVRDFVRDRTAGLLAAGDRIVVRPPDYVEVAIEADLVVVSLDQAAEAETTARTTLEALLHPVHGGPDGTGWDFGRPIWKSDVCAALERIAVIDRVEHLVFRFRGRTDPDRVAIGPNELLASGRHVLRTRKA